MGKDLSSKRKLGTVKQNVLCIRRVNTERGRGVWVERGAQGLHGGGAQGLGHFSADKTLSLPPTHRHWPSLKDVKLGKAPACTAVILSTLLRGSSCPPSTGVSLLQDTLRNAAREGAGCAGAKGRSGSLLFRMKRCG